MVVALLMLKNPCLSLLPVLFYSQGSNNGGADGVVWFHGKDGSLCMRKSEKVLPFSSPGGATYCPTIENAI